MSRWGGAQKGTKEANTYSINIACGRCIGCNTDKAKDWSLRCQHEFTQHLSTLWGTPTYSDENLPPTLIPKHLQGYLKRVREHISRGPAPTPIRYFASGEYGEQTKRPHYHVIFFGANESHIEAIRKAWPYGEVRDIKPACAESIAYVAGYAAKKYGEQICTQKERVDPRTGKVYIYQPPFIRMSSGGKLKGGGIIKGIGAYHRDNFWRSWTQPLVTVNGFTQRTPRYYKDQANKETNRRQQSRQEQEQHEAMSKVQIPNDEQMRALEQIAKDKHEIKAARRNKN